MLPLTTVYLKNGKPYRLTCINIAPTHAEVERAHGLGARLEEEAQRSTPLIDMLSPDDKAFLKEVHTEVADDAASSRIRNKDCCRLRFTMLLYSYLQE